MATNDVSKLISEYQGNLDHDFLQALAAGYALVAMADGRLDLEEVSGFYMTLKDAQLLEGVLIDELDDAFSHLVEALNSDYTTAAKQAEEWVLKMSSRGVADRELIVKMGRKALAADEKLEIQEEAALKRLCEVLRLDPENY